MVFLADSGGRKSRALLVDRFFDLEARYAASGGELPEKRFHEYTSSADRYGTIYHASPSCGEEEKEKDDEPEPIEFLGMNVNASGSINLYDTVAVTFSEPVAGLTKDHFYLDQKVDTLWEAVDFDFFPDTTNSLNFFIKRPWKYGEEYRLEVDSATIFSAYGKWNDVYSGEFKIKKEDEYGHLYINIEERIPPLSWNY